MEITLVSHNPTKKYVFNERWFGRALSGYSTPTVFSKILTLLQLHIGIRLTRRLTSHPPRKSFDLSSTILVVCIADANPGEFTHQALLGGRLDLTKFEGLNDLIEADTEVLRITRRRS